MTLTGHNRTILVLTLAPVLVYLCLLNITDRVKWKTPTDGFRWEQTEDGIRLSAVEGGRKAEGVRVGDRLIDINGLRVRSLDDYTEVVEVLSVSPQDQVTVDYTFERADSEITIPVVIEARSQIGPTDIPLIIVAFSFLIIGILTFLRNSRSAGAFHFTLVCIFAFILLSIRYSGRADAFDVVMYWFSAVAFLVLPPLFLHFCSSFPERSGAFQEKPHTQYLLYFPAILLGFVHTAWFLGRLRIVGLSRTPTSGVLLDKIELVHFVVFFLLAGLVLIRSRRLAARVVQRKQMQWITTGTLLGFFPFGLFYVLPYLLDLPIYPWMEISVVSLCLIPLSFGYAIAKFRLRDVDLIFKKGLSYVVASSALLAFYVGAALLIGRAVQDLSPQSGFVLLAISALAVSVFFAPLRDKIQEQLDRQLYKDRYGYRRSLVDFGQTLASELHLPRLVERITDRIQKALDVTPVMIFLRDDHESNRFHLEACLGLNTIDRPAPIELPEDLVHELAIESGSLDLDSGSQKLTVVRDSLYRWGIRYVEPFAVRGRLIGFLASGRRKNGDFLSSEDLEMVSSLAGYASIAMENALLYRSLESKANELMQLRLYSENVVESINLGVAVVTAEGEVTVWNSAMVQVTGIKRDAAVEKHLDSILPKDLVEALYDLREGSDWLVQNPCRLYKAHYEVSQQARLINVTLSPFISHESVNTGTLLVFDDITDKVRLENQLQQAERLSSIGLFAAGLAHEVNTPLAGISSYAQLLLDETSSDDPRRELLERIEKQSFRASEIVNNLLNFARFSDRDFEEVNINSLILDTLSLLEHQFRKGEILVDVEFEPTLPKTVGNGGKLQQVFMNLLLNARDSMPQGGSLHLATRRQDSELVVQFKDTGAGISKEDIKRIYDPFFTTKPVGKGTGLGLSISYGIIQEHSGRISVDSEPGEGTTFSLYLPLKRVH